MRYFRLYFYIFCISSPSICLGNDSTSLDNVLNVVNSKFPILLGAMQEIERAEGEKRSALGGFDVTWKTKGVVAPEGYYRNSRVDSVVEKPTSLWGLNLYGGYRQGDRDFPVYDGKYETLPAGELRAGIQLPIFRDREIDQRRADLRLAELGVDVASVGVEAKRIEVINKATQRYWYWVGAGRKYSIVEDLLSIARERLRGIEERVNHGDLPEFELKDNKRSILQRESQLVKAERAFQNAGIELAVFLGNEEEVLLRSKVPKVMLPPGPKSIHSSEELTNIAIGKRPEIKAIRILQNQLETELKLAKNQTDPKLDFMFQVSKDLGDGNKTKEQTEVESGVLVEIPLQVRKAEGKIASTEAKLRKIEQEMMFYKKRIEADIKDAISALENARNQIYLNRKELKYARELEAGERSRFQAGESTIFIVNLREQATADTALKEVEALQEYHVAEANLKAALGEW